MLYDKNLISIPVKCCNKSCHYIIMISIKRNSIFQVKQNFQQRKHAQTSNANPVNKSNQLLKPASGLTKNVFQATT